jgi:hypothetical protein
MSKKLIAIASAAALGLSALVATPASATTTFSIVASGTNAYAAGVGTAGTPLLHLSLQDNELLHADADTAGASNNVVRIKLSATNGRSADAVTITSAGGVKVLGERVSDTGTALTTAAGSTALTDKAAFNNGILTFYAFTTSTTAGTVNITSNGNTVQLFIASRVGSPYNVTAEFPAAIATGGAADVFAKVTDVFGNQITVTNSNHVIRAGGTAVFNSAATSGSLTLKALGATPTTDTWRWDTTKSAWKSNVTAAVAGTVAMTVEAAATDLKVGLPAPSSIVFASISSASLTAQIATLTAQVTALQAALAATVTKAKYNKLVRKWNRANPSNKVKRVS